MTEERFRALMTEARAVCSGPYLDGYQRGLRRAYHGERFGTDEEHARWSADDSTRGDGYRDGLSGARPRIAEEVDGGLNAGRTRPAKLLTMLPEDWERLDEIASRWGCKRSQAVARLVREASLPPRPRPPK